MRGEPAARMPVPEAAVDEDRRPVSRQHEVGSTGQSLSMEPEPVAAGMQVPANAELGFGVDPANATHHPAAGRSVDDVRHGSDCGSLQLGKQTSDVTKLRLYF